MDAIQDMEFRLWNYIDGGGDPGERSLVERLVREQADWKEKYAELLEVHALIGQTELDEPSMRFTQNVMEEIARTAIAPATRQYINNKIIWGIAAFFLTVITAFLVYGFSQVDWSSDSGQLAGGIDLSRIDYSPFFDNTFVIFFMMVNIILGLLLFDRYLASRKKQYMKQD